MRKTIVPAVLAALVVAPAMFAGPAFARPATMTASAVDGAAAYQLQAPPPPPPTPRPPGEPVGEYGTRWKCEVAGAAGQVRGQWRDFRCYKSDYVGKWILYVIR